MFNHLQSLVFNNVDVTLSLGQVPYQKKNIPQIISYVCQLNGHLEYPSLCPECPPTFLDQLNDCWRYDPQERPSFHILVDILFKTKTELGKIIPDIQDSGPEENLQLPNDQAKKTSDSEHIEQQDKSTNCHKYKKHKSCAIFTMLFLVMVSAGAIWAFRNFIWPPEPPTTTEPIIPQNNITQSMPTATTTTMTTTITTTTQCMYLMLAYKCHCSIYIS